MKQEIKAPSVGESITEVRIGRWLKEAGTQVKNGEAVLEIESDKATVEVVAESDGVLSTVSGPGDTVPIGQVVGYIEVGAKAAGTVVNAVATPAAPTAAVATAAAPSHSGTVNATLSPAVRRMTEEHKVDATQVAGTGRNGQVLKGDVVRHLESPTVAKTPTASPVATPATVAGERRVPMTSLRQKIAERLVMAQHTAAILTTFNECDMTNVMAMRNQYKEAFKTKHGVPLSFMSFFTRAVVEALKAIPAVNARIDGKDIVYHDFQDVGVAVGTERGLVVPVVRGAGLMSFVEIERAIGELAKKARESKLSIKELSGGTFTISNGGTYGSLLSTPILNPPQSGILGMHNIVERPMAVNGQVVIRPMMYLALSYDHRIIDGKEAVTFLIKVKEGIENPALLGFEGV